MEKGSGGGVAAELSEAAKEVLREGDYFHGQLYRSGAEDLLRYCDPGAFLVRESPADGSLVLSVAGERGRAESGAESLFEEELDDFASSGVYHIKIQLDYRGYFTVDGRLFFGQVHRLIEHHLEIFCDGGAKAPRYYRKTVIPESKLCLSHPVGRAAWELIPEQLQLGPPLSRSRFGSLHRGSLKLSKEAEPIPVSIKILKVGAAVVNSEKKRLFLTDAFALNLIGRHPHIVHFFGCSLLEDEAKMVKEFSPVGSLRSFLEAEGKRSRPLPLQHSLALGLQLSSALAFVQEKGLVHLDLTSHNFLLFPGPNLPRAKLANFSHTRRNKEGWHVAQSDLGLIHPRWAAPELLHSARALPASDVFSLAVCLCELFSPQPELLPYPEIAEPAEPRNPDEERRFRGRVEAAASEASQRLPLPIGPPLTPLSVANAIAAALRPDPSSRPPLSLLRQPIQHAILFYPSTNTAPTQLSS